LLGTVKLVLKPLALVLQLCSFSLEEVLILCEHVDLSSERFTAPLNLMLALLHLVHLGFESLGLLFEVLLVNLKLPDLVHMILLLYFRSI